jgi:hypothetical protein
VVNRGIDEEDEIVKHPEQDECIALMQLVTMHERKYPELRWLMHIPNGGKRSKAEAGKFKAMGVRAGVSDYFLPVRRKQVGMAESAGFWIEMKSKDGKLSVDQSRFLDDMLVAGYATGVCHGAEEAWRFIEMYLKWERK